MHPTDTISNRSTISNRLTRSRDQQYQTDWQDLEQYPTDLQNPEFNNIKQFDKIQNSIVRDWQNYPTLFVYDI